MHEPFDVRRDLRAGTLQGEAEPLEHRPQHGELQYSPDDDGNCQHFHLLGGRTDSRAQPEGCRNQRDVEQHRRDGGCCEVAEAL